MGQKEAAAQTEVQLRATVAERERQCVEARQRAQQAERAYHELTEQVTLLHAQAELQSRELTALRSGVAEARAQLPIVEAERDGLQQQTTHLIALKDRLDRECEQLRRVVGSADERERQRAEIHRLHDKLAEIEEQYRAAVQRHSAAVSGYMFELNQRAELLRQRDNELQKLHEQLSLLQQALDDATTQLTAGREARELLDLRVSELESARAVQAVTARADSSVTGDPRRFAPAPVAQQPAQPAPRLPVGPPPTPARTEARVEGDEQGVVTTVVYVDDHPPSRALVHAVVGRLTGVRCVSAEEAQPRRPGDHSLLVVNLLACTPSPLTVIAASEQWGVDEPYALAYAVEGARGCVLGMVDFFPHPFDADACATRLMGRPRALQRFLAVSQHVEAMSALRQILSRMNCSASVAFDSRQAIELIPILKPDAVLVDCTLPRGEGLRLLARLRLEASTAALPIAVMWGQAISSAEFRQQAVRAANDGVFPEADLAQAIEQAIREADSSRGESRRRRA